MSDPEEVKNPGDADDGLEFPSEDSELDEITRLVQEFAKDKPARAPGPPGVNLEPESEGPPASNPYFQRYDGSSTGEISAIRPLSEAVVQPFRPPELAEGVVLEPQSDDETLNQAILTKRLPQPPKSDPLLAAEVEVSGRREVTVEDLENVTAHIPEAGGSDTDVRVTLPQHRVLEDPGLLLGDAEFARMRARIGQQDLLGRHLLAMQRRTIQLLRADGSVPFGLGYYTQRAVGAGAAVVENPTLLEGAFMGRMLHDEDLLFWAKSALLAKCAQGQWLDQAGASDAVGVGCVTGIRDVALAYDFLRPELSETDRARVSAALHSNGRAIAPRVADRQTIRNEVRDHGAMALGLASLLLMGEEAYYPDARQWLDTAESRAQALLVNRIFDNGRPAGSDFAGLVALMRFLMPFAQAYRRYYHEDMLMGEGGNLSRLPWWLAHQFGVGRSGLISSGGIAVIELKRATPLLARLADTYRDGVAQWLLQQVSVVEATRRMRDEAPRGDRAVRLELPAQEGLDSVLTSVFFDPDLAPASPGVTLGPGARLSDTRAVVRSGWSETSPIVMLRANQGTLPRMHLVSSGVRAELGIEPDIFLSCGGESVNGRVRDYIDLGGAAYINGDYKGLDGSLAQRHLLYVRSENTALLFDRFDIGDGRTLKKARFRVGGVLQAQMVDRGTLAVQANDGSGRQARMTFFSNGFSRGVETGNDEIDPGLSLEFNRGRGDLACVISLGKPQDAPSVRRLNVKERGRVYRVALGEGALLFNGWPNGMPQQCGWVWTDGLLAFVDRTDDYPGRYIVVKATSVLAYDMHDGIHIGFGASHPDDPEKPVEFSVCAAGPQAVVELSMRAHLRLSFPGLKQVLVDGNPAEFEGEKNVYVLARPLEPGQHLVEVLHDSPGPESIVLRPEEGQLVGGMTIVQANIGDPIGVENARLLIDGQYYGATLETGPWVWKVNTLQLADGAHDLEIEARDVLGNVRRSTARRVSVDNLPPEAEVVQPHEGKRVRGVLICEARAEDRGGVARVQFCIDGKATGEPVSTPPFVREIDTSSLPDGEARVTAVATDLAGNIAESPPVRIHLTNGQAPAQPVELKIKPPLLGLKPGQCAPIEVFVIDDEDGVSPARVQWRQITGKGVVDRNNVFTAPSTEGPCVVEALLPGTELSAKLHVLVSNDVRADGP